MPFHRMSKGKPLYDTFFSNSVGDKKVLGFSLTIRFT